MIKRIRAARHYQRADDPILRLSRSATRSVARDVRAAFGNLGGMVDREKTIHALRHGVSPAPLIAWGHYREILKAPFGRLVRLRHAGAELGVRQINGTFAQARRKVRFRKAITLPDIGRIEIDTSHDVRSGAVASKDRPDLVYIDRRIPTWMHAFLAVHEAVERRAMEEWGYPYLVAHERFATPAERAAVEAAGIDWEHYTHEIDGYLDRIEHEDAPNPPPDPHVDISSAVSSGHHHSRSKHGDVHKDAGDAFNFDALSADTQREMREAQDELIQQLEDDARDTIETIIADGALNGTSVEDIADEIREMIGLTDTQAQAVLNYQRMLQDLDPKALERALRNSEYDSALQDAIDSGVDLADAAVDRMVSDYVDNYLDYRAATIAITESTRAANAGLHDAYSQAIERGALTDDAVTRFWQLGDSPCPVCESIPDNNPDGVGVDEDFDSDDGPVSDAPVHTRCECSVDYQTDLTKVPE